MTINGAMRSGFLSALCICLALVMAALAGPAEAKGKAKKKHHAHKPRASVTVTGSTAGQKKHPVPAAKAAPASKAKSTSKTKSASIAPVAPEPQTAPQGEAAPAGPRRAATLEEHRKMWAAYVSAKAKHLAAQNVYWKKIAAKRAIRKRKLAKHQAIVRSDYVLEQPSQYKGPEMPLSFFKVEKKDKPKKPEAPKKTLPVLADFLGHARTQYGFTPRRVSEIEFKRSFAREALTLGLTRDQVVKVYAFETGGYGAYDMQAGYDKATGKVYPVSTALGYAQLLNANSVSQVANHGDEFADRLEQLAKAPGLDSGRAQELKTKAAAVRSMFKWASSQSGNWYDQVRLCSTPKGIGVHALNIDSDVGPWVQVNKLNEISKFAAIRGMRSLTPAQLELMNLAGPGRGFEMMQPHLKDLPTANFFERGGYERNPVTNYRTGAELLAKIDSIMERNLKKDGAQEFVAAFDRK